MLPLLEVPEGPLVTADWLERHLEHPNVRVLDVRGRHPSSALPHAKLAEYEAEHIPGATFVDWERDFIDVSDPVPVQVAGASEFAARAGALGIGDGDLVVTYDDYYGIFAARVAWAFRYYGAESRVLDGGWVTWREAGASGHWRGRRVRCGPVHSAPATSSAANLVRGDRSA